MNSSMRIELEYLNIQLCQSRPSLLKLQSSLTRTFRETVYQFSRDLARCAAADDELREMFNQTRRDRRLVELGFRLGDVLIVDRHSEVPWSFKLEQATFRRVLGKKETAARSTERFCLQGIVSIPQFPDLRERIIQECDTPEDAARIEVLLRAVAAGPSAPTLGADRRVTTFLSGLTAAQVKRWRSAPETVPNLHALALAQEIFCPNGVFWDAAHRELYGRVDFSAHHTADAAPFGAMIPRLYAEGRLLARQLERLEGQTVQRLMLIATGSVIDVAADNEPDWVRVRRIEKRPEGVCIVGERMLGEAGTGAWPVQVPVHRVAHAEQIRERLRRH
jgi:hypothetical protein